MLQASVLKAIRWYQRQGGSRRFFNLECNFEPSCSEYTAQAIELHGLNDGLKLGLQRIRRCNDPDCIEKHFDPVPTSPASLNTNES